MIETRSVGEQLIQLCQQELARGKWAVGERFPSERELADAHGISRATANKVVAKLVSEGWLEIRRGLGTFVARRPGFVAALRELESFTDFAMDLGLEASTRVICFGQASADPDSIRAEMALNQAEPLIAFERRRSLSGVVVIFEERWVPAAAFPGLTEAALTGSFYRLCREQFDHRIERESHHVLAVMPPPQSNFSRSQPALCLEGIGLNGADQAIWKQRVYYRGDAFYLQHYSDGASSRTRFSFQLQDAFLKSLMNPQSTDQP